MGKSKPKPAKKPSNKSNFVKPPISKLTKQDIEGLGKITPSPSAGPNPNTFKAPLNPLHKKK